MSQVRSVIVTDINPQTGAQTVDQLRKEFPSAEISFEECDVSSWESQAAVFEKVFAQQGRIDFVFANAGITEKGSLLPQNEAENGPLKPDLATLNVNLVGVIYSVQLAIHYMSKNASGHGQGSNGLICCTASNAGLYPFPMAPMYATTKHGVVGLVRSLARTLIPKGIRINALAPAVIETNIAPHSDLFRSMVITPMSTVCKAVAQFGNDETLTGKVAELHGEHVTFAEPPAYVDEDTGKNIETFWNLGYA
ncbi:short chain dehydrogenase/reductase [Penicillium longicatenatum]|uniref:short chain dehydrogenase/reductase n=1 Tax=Penicillium longicatenatum TaxID=1561947 RepID=UPI0025473033|nr:short chain dehydrogenase/reductase [Penicillium longicatenatum]KAJ5657539.1 short chain dehydrogenase/reductase [Penicillium longicatenatum]